MQITSVFLVSVFSSIANINCCQLSTFVIISCLTSACSKNEPQASAPQAIPVKLEEIETGIIQESDRFVGRLNAAISNVNIQRANLNNVEAALKVARSVYKTTTTLASELYYIVNKKSFFNHK